MRACGDLKHSLANLACTVSAPIQLVSWGHLTQLPHLLTKGGGDWVLFKADHEAAYKQIPIDPADQKNAIVALRHPVSQLWYGFVTRTLIFGSIAAVLHYNVISRILVALTDRVLGIPLVGYFGDFAAMIRAVFGEDALRAFAEFCRLLGFQLKPVKSSVGNSPVFLGLLGGLSLLLQPSPARLPPC